MIELTQYLEMKRPGSHRTLRLLLLASLCLALTGCPRPESPVAPVTPTPAPEPTPMPTPLPTPPPTPYVPNKRLEVGKVFNGMQIRTSLQTEWGTTATADRNDPTAYALDLQVKVRIPKPHNDLTELARLNAQLPALLPQLAALLQTAKISPTFDELYRLKTAALQQNLLRLDNLLSRHNFFDCETIIELEHPATKRRAVLMQADMDTDTDGSDSDRMPDVDGSSVTFQPFTSYKWGKKTQQPNSFIAPREAKLRQLQQDLATPGTTSAKQQEIKGAIARVKEEISDLHKYSYLVASLDPYVVLPGSMFGQSRHPFSPSVGDYCVVIYDTRLFPAVIGDVGPSNLIGEASLRICREISAKADANNRAVNDLKVTYLLFPGTAEKPFEAPNLEKWRTRCDALLRELGGYTGELVAWEDLSKPKATPAPAAPPPTPVRLLPTLPTLPSASSHSAPAALAPRSAAPAAAASTALPSLPSLPSYPTRAAPATPAPRPAAPVGSPAASLPQLPSLPSLPSNPAPAAVAPRPVAPAAASAPAASPAAPPPASPGLPPLPPSR